MLRPPRPIEVSQPGTRRAVACAKRVSLLAAWFGLAGLLVLIGPSCSAEKNYKVLRVFFDGVPDPNAPQVAEGAEDRQTNPNAPKMLSIVHKPYGDGKCGECHEGDTSKFESFQKLSSDVCMKCHAKVLNQYPIMHGPVSAGECLLCHNPHESSVKGLLNDDAPAVCVQCHVTELLPQDPPEHQDPRRSCLDCHAAHGGEKHGLLLPSYRKSTTQPSSPATNPTTLPAGGSPP